ncbi:hypothetical protein [Nocardiopsis nanhaiensis]
MADIPSTGHVGEAGAQRFAMRGDGVGARSAAFVAFAREEARAGRKVVALYPAWQASDAQRAVNFARGSQRSDSIAGISVDLSPLALSLIADQLAYLAPYLPPGMVAALCEELPRHLLAGAWLRTVSGLATLPTNLRQHMGSYAPTVSFLAYCAPTAHVGRLRPSEVASGLPFRPVQPVQLLCSTPDPSITGVFDEHLPRAIQPVATRTLPAQPLGSTYWGTGKYVEFVALSAHPQALAYAAGSIRAAACSWCGEPMSAKPCPFCSADSTGSPARSPYSASAAPVSGRPSSPQRSRQRNGSARTGGNRQRPEQPLPPAGPGRHPAPAQAAERPPAPAPSAMPAPSAAGAPAPAPARSGPPNGHAPPHRPSGPSHGPPDGQHPGPSPTPAPMPTPAPAPAQEYPYAGPRSGPLPTDGRVPGPPPGGPPPPGHRPPSPSERPEDPPVPDHAERPGPPRTYSR